MPKLSKKISSETKYSSKLHSSIPCIAKSTGEMFWLISIQYGSASESALTTKLGFLILQNNFLLNHILVFLVFLLPNLTKNVRNDMCTACFSGARIDILTFTFA